MSPSSSRRAPRALILAYHRVASPRHDPQRLCVTPTNFARQLDVLQQVAEVVPLERLLDVRRADSRARPRVAITFDDGYLDNLTTAAPLLRARDLPATFFVVTQAVLQRPALFWWEVLQRCVLETEALPARLDLEIGACRARFDVASAGDGVAAGDDRPALSPRARLYGELHRRLMASRVEVQQRVVARLARWAGVAPEPAPDARPLRPDELRELSSLPGVAIGSHTRTHPRLSTCGPSEQRREIEGSCEELRELVHRPVRFLAYPYGVPRDLSPWTPTLARLAGLRGACLGIENTQSPRLHPFRMTRALVPDVDGGAFARWLARRL